MPVSTSGHSSGVHLILDFIFGGIQFFEITLVVKGYGRKDGECDSDSPHGCLGKLLWFWIIVTGLG
jgi:hypothetical protein